ncbi:hypothetical protein CEXT_128061 [Caerostris extrusa]|uniref:Uncharacterized protein n=1 Tax=Caerostris extrusa TaxID=172846 RepID=A0AAV4P0H3_CAEEX|nr:hypothetical protein CEXT_128061 [Caerostris extrusa]
MQPPQAIGSIRFQVIKPDIPKSAFAETAHESKSAFANPSTAVSGIYGWRGIIHLLFDFRGHYVECWLDSGALNGNEERWSCARNDSGDESKSAFAYPRAAVNGEFVDGEGSSPSFDFRAHYWECWLDSGALNGNEERCSCPPQAMGSIRFEWSEIPKRAFAATSVGGHCSANQETPIFVMDMSLVIRGAFRKMHHYSYLNFHPECGKRLLESGKKLITGSWT